MGKRLVLTKPVEEVAVTLTGEQIVEGVKHFLEVPRTENYPVEQDEMSNKAYVDWKLGELRHEWSQSGPVLPPKRYTWKPLTGVSPNAWFTNTSGDPVSITVISRYVSTASTNVRLNIDTRDSPTSTITNVGEFTVTDYRNNVPAVTLSVTLFPGQQFRYGSYSTELILAIWSPVDGE